MPLNYVFFGTPAFCLRALDRLVQAGYQPAAVVCQPDRPRGRGRRLSPPATKAWAQALAVPVHQPERCSESGFLECLQDLRPDLGLVYAFGQILPASLLRIPRLGFINIHPPLLPRWRGAAPVQWALLSGDDKTGVSIIRVTPRLDDGDIILQRRVAIHEDENAVELGQRLADLGGRLAADVLHMFEQGRVSGRSQDESLVTWAPSLKKADGRLDWRRPARELHNRVRAVQPWPGAWSKLRNKVLKIQRTRLRAGESVAEARPGQVVAARGDEILVATGEGVLQLVEVQLEGRKRLDARAFLQGRTLAVGDMLT